MKKLGIGCYGTDGHQILNELKDHPLAKLTAVCGIQEDHVKEFFGEDLSSISFFDKYEDMLNSDDVELVSLCSPRRRNQPREAVNALNAGKHVLAEKPAVFTLEELDTILKTAEANKVYFREMSGSELVPPFPEITKLVRAGAVGEVVQIWGQKSYPYHSARPQDPDVDGGIFQAGLHALRFMCGTCGLRVAEVNSFATYKGNPLAGGGLHMAANVVLSFSSGAVGGITVNYLNPQNIGYWGNDQLRIFGTEGMIETVDGTTKGRLINGDGETLLADAGKELKTSYFTHYADMILNGTPMPTPFEIELGFMEDTIKVIDSIKNS